MLLFLSIALCWGLGDGTGHAISAVIGAVLWAVIAAVLAVMGRTAIKGMTGMSRTADTVKRSPPAVKGDP